MSRVRTSGGPVPAAIPPVPMNPLRAEDVRSLVTVANPIKEN